MAFNRKWFNIIKILFPRSNAFQLFVQKKLTQVIEGLTALPDDFKTFLYNIYLDLFPTTTRAIDEWESQFGIVNQTGDEDDRRQAIDNRWKLKGGQGPDYIQGVLNDAGFDVQVHENFPPVDPALLLPEGSDNLIVNGEIILSVPKEILAVSGGACYSGGNKAYSGYYEEFGKPIVKEYEIPTDPALWPCVWFIGGDATRNASQELTNIDIAYIDADRKAEFIDLILKMKPSHTWVGVVARATSYAIFSDGSYVNFSDSSRVLFTETITTEVIK